MTNPTRFLHEHAALLTIATRLRDDRAAAYPRAVETGKLTAEDAAEKGACAAALVALWQHVVAETPFDVRVPLTSLGASWHQLTRDLDAALAASEARARKAPTDQVRRDAADCLAAMRLHMTPTGSTGLPHIVFVHDFNLWSRAKRWPEQALAA